MKITDNFHPHQWLRKISISKNNKDRKDRNNLKVDNFTIFSSNCIGGIIYHSLNKKFLSPTINLYIQPSDYVEMLSHPKKYFISGIMKEVKQDQYNYPVGEIYGRKIYGVHYNSYKDLKSKWDIRCKRINWNNVYVLMIERDGCTFNDLKRFDNLPYKNKVVFTKKKYDEIKNSFVILGTYDLQNGNVKDLCDHLNFFTGIRTIDAFDYVYFFNTGRYKLSNYISIHRN